MRKSRFKESQIVRVLKQVEGRGTVSEVCREYAISMLPIVASALLHGLPATSCYKLGKDVYKNLLSSEPFHQ